MKFGDFFKGKRKEIGLTLRQFCENTGQDPAYISRLENNLSPAPSSTDKLKSLAKALRINPDTEEWVTYFDLASLSRREVPANIDLDSAEAMELLPTFYRTLRNDPISKDEAKKLLRLIKGQIDGNE